MKSNSNFNPLEWAKKENAPQKNTVKNQTPAAVSGDWVQTDLPCTIESSAKSAFDISL